MLEGALTLFTISVCG